MFLLVKYWELKFTYLQVSSVESSSNTAEYDRQFRHFNTLTHVLENSVCLGFISEFLESLNLYHFYLSSYRQLFQSQDLKP